MEIDFGEMRQLFFEDAEEHLEAMEEALAILEKDTTDDASIAALFRSVHSLKGDSGAVGLDELGQSLHSFESGLDRMRNGECCMTDDVFLAMRDVVDKVDGLIKAAQEEEAFPEGFEEAVDKLLALQDASASASATTIADEPDTAAADFGLFDEEEASTAEETPTAEEATNHDTQDSGQADPYSPFFGDYLIAQKLLSIEQVMEILNAQRHGLPLFGELLMKAGYLTIKELMRTLMYGEATGERIGEMAVALGYLQPEELQSVVEHAQELRPGFRATAVKLGLMDREAIQNAYRDYLDAHPDAGHQREEIEIAHELDAIDVEPNVDEDFDTDEELLIEFIGESNEHLEIAEEQLLIIESEPKNADALNAIYRAFHTIKGVSSFLALESTRHLAHEAESMLNLARDGKLDLSGSALEVALASVDGLKRQIGFADRWLTTKGKLGSDPKLPHLLAAIDAVSKGKKADLSSLTDAPKNEVAQAQPKEPASKPASPQGAAKSKSAAPAATHVKESIKVDRDRLDKLINVIGELVIGQAMVEEEVADWQAQTGQESMAMSQLNKTVRDLQELSLSLRMVPIGSVFHKMARIVRDLGRKLGKDIRFETEGDETELDKTVVDQIGDPLLHMVRNAADHGIESPEDRVASKKSKQGRVCLRAYHQGGNIYIEIQDDGKGLDRDVLLKKAIERGIVSENENLTDQQIFNLIFAPGFSTAAQVTDVSGRGVGMDVVRRNVEALQGSVSVDSTIGHGSTVTIRLPLTLAILDGLSIRVAEEVYIIPILSVVESFSAQPDDLKTIAGKGEVVLVRGEVVPLMRLSRVFSSSAARSDDDSTSLVVIVEDRGNKFALLVDELLGQSQVVIKNLEKNYRKVEGIAGATILGDGQIAMIVDVFGLVTLATSEAAVPDSKLEAIADASETEPLIAGAS